MRLELGTSVRLADGAQQTLDDVVIDASTGSVTHIVVQPENDPSGARLVPMELAEESTDGQSLSLRCTTKGLEQLERVRDLAVLAAGEQPEQSSKWDVGVEDVHPTTQYTPSGFGEYGGVYDLDAVVSYDHIPKGEIELRQASAVYSADRHSMGSVHGVVVGADGRVTHLLLERGHLWWRREIPLPVDVISRFETDLVTLSVTKREVDALPRGRNR